MTLKQAVTKFDGDYVRIAQILTAYIKAKIADGYSPEQSTAMAVHEIGVEKITKALNQAIVGAVQGLDISASVSRQILQGWGKAYTVEGANLSQRIYQSAGNINDIVKSEVGRALNKTQGWQSAASQLQREVKITGDTPKYIRQLKAISTKDVSPAAQAKIQSVLRQAEREVRKLSLNEAPTKRLKASYESLIEAVKGGKQSAIDKAVDRAITEKSYYNAQRLVRTETAKAYGDSFFDKILRDDDVVGYQSILSPRHPVPDICDFYATSDLYGMGKGVFPKSQGAPYPYHPNCLCILKPVYKGEIGQLDDRGAVKYIKSLSDEKAKALFGSNYETVKQEPNLWRDYIKGFSDFVNHKTLNI